MGRSRSTLIHNLLGSLAVLAIIAGLGLGVPALNRALPSAKPVAADQPYLIDGHVTVVPPPGSSLDVTRTKPYPDRGVALFLVGAVRYAVTARPFTGDLRAATAQLRKEITANRGYQITGREVAVRTRAGVPGWQGGYSSPGRVGLYTVFLAGGTAVDVTIAGGDPDLRAALPALRTSIGSVDFQAAGQ